MLKDNINFTVKGYDMLKTIQNKLVELKSQKLCNNFSFSNNENKEDLCSTTNDENSSRRSCNKCFNQLEYSIVPNADKILYNPKAVYAKIFSNMNFSFAIEFSMENFLQYYSQKQKNENKLMKN